MTVKLLTEHHLRFLSLKGGCRGLSESTLVKMPHCWKSRVTAQMISLLMFSYFISQNLFMYLFVVMFYIDRLIEVYVLCVL